ncbi:MAG: hypothetical protein ACKOC0_04585, partial [Cytophagales bacterium]
IDNYMKKLTFIGIVFIAILSAQYDALGQNKERQKKWHGHGRGWRGESGYHKKSFPEKIYRVTRADSLQKIKMKPTVERASKRLEAIRLSYQAQEKRVMDSLKLQLKPMLNATQIKLMEEFELKKNHLRGNTK